MPVPWQETAKSPRELKDIQTLQPSSRLDAKIESDKARDWLEVSLDEGGVKKSGSHLTTLRDSTSGIETEVSIMNKKVTRMASLDDTIDV